MAIVLKDRVKESTAVTGTGTATLLGAAAGYQAFSVIGNGNTTYYAIVDAENGTWEVGTGTYSTTGPTLTRTTVFESSNAGALVDFAAGAKDVFITYPAERAIYEEPSGNTLIDGGPLTVVGAGVTGYTSFSAVLAELYGNVDSFAQLYAQNLNDGSSASADLVAYNDLGDGLTNFVDVGINSSNYTSVDYPIFTPNSAYLFNDGGEMFVGSATDDVVFFAGGVDTTDEAARIDKTTKALTTIADVNVGADLDVVGATTFGSTVTLDANPTTALEAATKQYVDSAVSTGFVVHGAVLLATAAALPSNTYNNGTAGVGATLTGLSIAQLEIDGVPVTVGDRVLVKDEAAPANNGAYTVTVDGSSAVYVLTRTTDFDTVGAGEVATNAYFYVTAGDTNIGSSWIMSQTAAITIGTTALPFDLFAQPIGYAVVSPLNLTGTTLSLAGTVAATNGGTGTATVTTGDLLYGSGTNTWGKLAAGAGYKSLVMNAGGTNVEWNAVALNQSGAVSGALGATNGGTGQNAYAVGDILYSGVTDTLSKLAGNTTTTKKYLIQTGTGSGSAAPEWSTIAGADVGGAVSSATNVAGGAANQIVYQSGSGATAFATAPTTSGTFLGWNGSALAWAAAGATITDDTTTNASYYPVWANGTSGSLTTAYVSSTKMSFNPSTGVLTASGFSGPLTGNVTGNASGSAGSVTNAVTFAASGGAAAGTTYNGSAARTVDYSSVGAQAALVSGTNIKTVNGTTLLGSGNLAVSASPAGSSSQVQYNSGGAFAGSANLVFDGTNLTCGGTITANSDESLKTNWRDLPADFVEQLAKVKHGTYDRVDVELTQDGVSAQSLQNLLPNSVLKGEDGKLSVAYGNAALVAAIALAERVVQLEAIVAKLTQGASE